MNTVATVSNADVLPLIKQLGPVPAVMRDYDDNRIVQETTGLSVYFNFTRELTPGEVTGAGNYCVAAFQALGFKAAGISPAGQQQGYGPTAVRLHIPTEGIVQGKYIEVQQRDFGKREVPHNYDDVEAQWKALRVIRQAATLA